MTTIVSYKNVNAQALQADTVVFTFNSPVRTTKEFGHGALVARPMSEEQYAGWLRSEYKKQGWVENTMNSLAISGKTISVVGPHSEVVASAINAIAKAIKDL